MAASRVWYPRYESDRTQSIIDDKCVNNMCRGQNASAQIPWLEKSGTIGEILECKLVAIFQRGRNHINKCARTDLFTYLIISFPYHLPGRYHRMKCTSLLKHSKQTEYWNNATHFIYCCTALEHTFMAHLVRKVEECQGKQLKIHHLMQENFHSIGKLLKATLKDGVELCKSAAEYLLEPWILIQLPFQPTLLHQWAATLLAEALIFQKRISQIFSLGFPSTLTAPVKILKKMLQLMMECAAYLLEVVVAIWRGRAKNINLHVTMRPFFDDVLETLSQALPIVEFVTSDESVRIVESIETICLEELNRGGEVDASHEVLDQEPTLPIYDFWFWMSECEPKELFTGAVSIKHGRSKGELMREYNKRRQFDAGIDRTSLNALKEFVAKNLIYSRRLEGANQDLILSAVEKLANGLMVFYKDFQQFEDTSTEDKEMKNGMCGVINNIICLYSDVKTSESIDLLTWHIFEEVKKTCNGISITKMVQSRPPVRTFKQIEVTLHTIMDQAWIMQKLLEKIKPTHILESEKTEGPSFEQDPKKVAKHFQDRIKNLVYSMACKHLKSMKDGGNFKWFPECQFVQYILPCFVATYLGACKDSSANAPAKKKVMRFVHQLISSYEQHEYLQEMTPEPKVAMQYAFCTDVDHVHKLLLYETKRLLQAVDLALQESYITRQNLARFIACFSKYSAAASAATKSLCNKSKNMETSSNWYNLNESFVTRIFSFMPNIVPKFERQQACALHMIFYSAFKADVGDTEAKCMYYILDFRIMGHTKSRSLAEQCPVSRGLLTSAQQLPIQQLAGLFVFLVFRHVDTKKCTDRKDVYQGPDFSLDKKSVFFWSMATGDRWKIKQVIGPLLMFKGRTGKYAKDPSLASIALVESLQCYARVREMITPDGSVSMKYPGEITFVPVKHCRWCGLIRVEKFRVCAECVASIDYLDVNFFCSEKCETEAFHAYHGEEHARFYSVKLGLEKL